MPDDLDVTLIRKPVMPVLDEPGKAVREALIHAVGCRPLVEEARGKKNACILICDITRPVPNGIVLPPLIDTLMEAGIEASSITVIIATGLHRPNEAGELREVVGDDRVLESVRVVNHFATNDTDHAFLGTTRSGTPVKLDRRFVEARVRIAVGLVEPHFMAGYSGGRKVIVPGVAHHDTIRVLHSTSLLKHERVANCILAGNPLHEEQLAATRMIGGCFAVNTVIDEERKMSFVNFGEIEASHAAAVQFVEPYMMVPVDKKFRTVVTSSAGYPLDRNYYQTVKGMIGVIDILEPGGNLIIASECSEGLGTKEYAGVQEHMIAVGQERFMEETSLKRAAAIDEWEAVMQIKAMKMGRVHLFSTCLSPEERALTGVRILNSVSDGVLASITEKGDRRVAVIPEGPYVIPVFRPL